MAVDALPVPHRLRFSHYSEKAWWALDVCRRHCGVSHEVTP